MDFLLVSHKQEKKDSKQNSVSICNLELWSNEDNLTYKGIFEFDYSRYGVKKHIQFLHTLSINMNNGDITTDYEIVNDNISELKFFRNTKKYKKNDFGMLFDLSENGFYRGEKRTGYWGSKYSRKIDEITRVILEQFKPKFKSNYIYDKLSNDKSTINTLYDMVVDFHLDMKGIKGHDGVYYHIQTDYPKKKWLELNEYKFLPAVLDSYGIKSKYLIGELNKNWGKPIQLSSLNYLCKLFGDNYISYIKQFMWEINCYETPPNKKIHELKNESEKSCMVSVINKWEKDTLKSDSFVYSINKLLSIRDLLEQRGMDLKFKAKNDNDFDNIMETWSGHKLHFARGYKVRYLISDEFIGDIERDIKINNNTFKPKLLLTEDDFRIEGHSMKNCMSKQFPHGVLYLYVSLQLGRKKVNIQYRKGKMVQSYGKANTPVKDEFLEAIDILTTRFAEHPNIEWSKEKFDFLTH